MKTINISLPLQLKKDIEKLIEFGFFASFSDAVRASLRKTFDGKKYDMYFEEAKRDVQRGKIKPLATDKDIDMFVDNLAS